MGMADSPFVSHLIIAASAKLIMKHNECFFNILSGGFYILKFIDMQLPLRTEGWWECI